VDRNRFDADPDTNFHVDADLDPNWHQNNAGILILPQVLHMLENLKFFYFWLQHCHFTMFCLSHPMSNVSLNILDSKFEFSKKIILFHLL
jgi:hypothetical protein